MTINPVVIAKNFYIICNTIFLALFISRQDDRGLLGPILSYFRVIEVDGRRMLYLYYLVLLTSVKHLSTLWTRIQNNSLFCEKLIYYLEHIIKCDTREAFFPNFLYEMFLDTREPMSTPEFMDLFQAYNEVIVRKVQMHFPSHNLICYKYNKDYERVYRFDFLKLKILS